MMVWETVRNVIDIGVVSIVLGVAIILKKGLLGKLLEKTIEGTVKELGEVEEEVGELKGYLGKEFRKMLGVE